MFQARLRGAERAATHAAAKDGSRPVPAISMDPDLVAPASAAEAKMSAVVIRRMKDRIADWRMSAIERRNGVSVAQVPPICLSSDPCED
jgi:hypothetical protein